MRMGASLARAGLPFTRTQWKPPENHIALMMALMIRSTSLESVYKGNYKYFKYKMFNVQCLPTLLHNNTKPSKKLFGIQLLFNILFLNLPPVHDVTWRYKEKPNVAKER